MKRWTRPVLILTVAATVTAAGTYVAYANWIVPSRQIQIKITSASMPRGVTPAVAGSGAGALVSWSAQEIAPGARMQSYIVTAHSVNQPPLPSITHTVTSAGGDTESVNFGFGELLGGEWYWTLAPKLQSRVGRESEESDRLAFAIPTDPPHKPSPLATTPPAAAEPPPKGSPLQIPEIAASPASSPSATSATSAIPMPTPSESVEPLTPPSGFTPGPPPPLGSHVG